MSPRFPCFRFDAHNRRATLLHPLARKELMVLPAQNCRSPEQGLGRHPASAFSAELASYIGWLARHHLLLRPEPLEVDACIEDVCVDGLEDASEDTGYAVQLETLVFHIPGLQNDAWLDSGRAGFVLLDGMLYSSFYLDVEELIS